MSSPHIEYCFEKPKKKRARITDENSEHSFQNPNEEENGENVFENQKKESPRNPSLVDVALDRYEIKSVGRAQARRGRPMFTMYDREKGETYSLSIDSIGCDKLHLRCSKKRLKDARLSLPFR